ncbi:MAG: EamA domain-containing protein [Burkholderia sp.]
MLQGVICGVAACMIWGTVYIAPLILGEYDPVLIALGRYFVFGALSAGLAFVERRELARYSAKDWMTALALGIVGNLVYYWMLAEAVTHAGAPIAGAFTALIPILVAVIGNVQAKATGRNIPWRRLAVPLSLVLLGMACLNGTEFVHYVVSGRTSSGTFWLGVAFAVGALFLWTWYPLTNAAWVESHPKASPRAWTTAQGVTLLPAAAAGLALYLPAHGLTPAAALGPSPVLFISVLFFLGIVASWVGILLWSQMSRTLPSALAGQMIVFETIFAVIYAHILRREWPTALMVIGMALLLTGIIASLRAFREPREGR